MNNASELIHSHWFFKIKKKNCSLVNSAHSGAWLHYSLNSHHEKQQNAASPNLRHAIESWWVLPSKITFFFLPNADMCGCGWTSPAATLPNSILHLKTYSLNNSRPLFFTPYQTQPKHWRIYDYFGVWAELFCRINMQF